MVSGPWALNPLQASSPSSPTTITKHHIDISVIFIILFFIFLLLGQIFKQKKEELLFIMNNAAGMVHVNSITVPKDFSFFYYANYLIFF